jgi:phage repressor protein C with HTH and peptisase S24 domain
MSTTLQKKSKGIPVSIAATEIGAEFRRVRISLGYTADVMAERMEISRGYLSEIENGKSTPSDKVMRHLERMRDVNFFTSEGKQVSKLQAPENLSYPKFQPAEPLGVHENGVDYRIKTVDVPLYRGVHASAGNGLGVPPDDPPEVHVSFSPQYMRHHFGRSGDGFAMIYVRGDSMQPGLLDGDEIVIDTRHRRVDRDGIYVITLRGDLKVKRIQQRLDGSLVVKSDNPAYDAELVTATQAEEFTVEGRLVWPRLR